jgi:hypothetical protein
MNDRHRLGLPRAHAFVLRQCDALGKWPAKVAVSRCYDLRCWRS